MILPHALLLIYRVLPPPLTPLMVMRLPAGDGLARDWTSLEDLSPAIRHAVLAAEDTRFCEHGGVDWTEMQNAWNDYQSSTRVRGASTITMQTARNLVLWPGRDLFRKAIEIYFAKYLEMIWPKRRILEVYLNIAEWGPGIYGAEAAAQRYFGKPARRLSNREAALMAAVLPNPRRWRPDRPTRYITSRAATIDTRRRQLGPLLDCLR